MLKFVKNVFFAGFFVLAVVLSAGCGSGTASCEFDDPTAPTFDLDGTWAFEVTNTTSSDPDCDGLSFGPVTIIITVTGSTVTVTVTDDPSFELSGQVSGSQVKLAGSLEDDGATIVVDCTTMPVVSADLITFTANVTASDDGESCSGTATGTITRLL